MKEYSWIYNTDPENLCRYSLGYCSRSPLLCIGVNPSTASPENLDPTIQSVARIAQKNSYDGWIMINLYPQRSTNPDKMHQQLDNTIHQQNLHIIKSILDNYAISDIWAAWGTLITKRTFLSKCLTDIYSMTSDYHWITFGSTSKAGHPHHPLYLSSQASKAPFHVDSVNSFSQI